MVLGGIINGERGICECVIDHLELDTDICSHVAAQEAQFILLCLFDSPGSIPYSGLLSYILFWARIQFARFLSLFNFWYLFIYIIFFCMSICMNMSFNWYELCVVCSNSVKNCLKNIYCKMCNGFVQKNVQSWNQNNLKVWRLIIVSVKIAI